MLKSRIAVSITTHNRYDVFKKSYTKIKELLPKNATLFVVDDGSKIPVPEATFRFETAQGIAAAKNKCFELAEGYDYHFAFDDDVYPLVENWHLEYINTGLNHLCFTFDKFSNGRPNGRIKIDKKDNVIYYKEPCGCMNFYTKACFDAVGGMDVDFGRWSYEHVGHSMRIHNAGLTPYPFMDVENSLDILYSFDWDETTERSVDVLTRSRLARRNEAKYRSELNSKKYIDFREPKDVIITTFFTTLGDTQRDNKAWDDSMRELINPLKESCDKFGVDLVVLDDTVNITPKHENPYFARWIAIKEHLEINNYRNVWCVDATDVEVLREPFKIIQDGVIYTGCEPSFTNNNIWLKRHHTSPYYNSIFMRRIQLKNAGILGGRKKMVLDFVTRICGMIPNVDKQSLTDMALFNLIASQYHNIRYGNMINTEFKAYKDNGVAIFKHK